MKTDLTQAELKTLLDYDPLTGIFTWKRRDNVSKSWNTKHAGTVAGCVKNSSGYCQIVIRPITYSAHRLAWLYVYGEWPSLCLDHINRIKTDNRMVNLRMATLSENLQNQVNALSNNKTGILGVTWHKKNNKYIAQIKVNGNNKHLGCFSTAQEAKNMYLTKKQEYHPFAQL